MLISQAGRRPFSVTVGTIGIRIYHKSKVWEAELLLNDRVILNQILRSIANFPSAEILL